MLSLQDKERQWESFRDGPQFGRHTWTTLQFFDVNAHRLIETVKVYMTVFNKIQEKDFAYSMGLTDDVDITSQYVILDIIAKVQTLIETTLELWIQMDGRNCILILQKNVWRTCISQKIS